jgi:hypothetical protein
MAFLQFWQNKNIDISTFSFLCLQKMMAEAL